jgi:AmiR/NasT family two-component response regulator
MSSDTRTGAGPADADVAAAAFVSERDLLVECQGELKVAEVELENLRAALVSARRIGAAIGIVMGTSRLTDDDAFALLTRVSQQQNRKLRLVAEDVIRTGTADRTA